MDTSTYREFVEQWGNAIVAKDGARTHAMLAPWLQARQGPGALHELLLKGIRAYADEQWDGAQLQFFETFTVDGNDSFTGEDIERLKAEPTGEFPDMAQEVTPANFRAWMVLSLAGPEDDEPVNAVADLWLAVVEVGGELRVGYYRLLDAD
jgi:hypothetical protein